MGYYDYLKELLSPVGGYDLENGAGAQELFVLEQAMDEVFLRLEELGRELSPVTAEGFGLDRFWELLPYQQEGTGTGPTLMALLRIRQGCFTTAQFGNTLRGCGLSATVEESAKPMTVTVKFPENRGIPENFEQVKAKLMEILPCHLEAEYYFTYTSWRELMAALSSWGQVQREAGSWRAIEIYEKK